MRPPPGDPEKVAGEDFFPSGAEQSVPVIGQALQFVSRSELSNLQQGMLDLMFDNRHWSASSSPRTIVSDGMERYITTSTPAVLRNTT